MFSWRLEIQLINNIDIRWTGIYYLYKVIFEESNKSAHKNTMHDIKWFEKSAIMLLLQLCKIIILNWSVEIQIFVQNLLIAIVGWESCDLKVANHRNVWKKYKTDNKSVLNNVTGFLKVSFNVHEVKISFYIVKHISDDIFLGLTAL